MAPEDLADPFFMRKVLRFGVTGLLVTAIHVVVAASLIEGVALAPFIANGAAFTVATITSYLVNTLWSFGSPLRGRNLLRFCVVSGIGLLLSMSIAGAAEYYQLSYWYGIGAVVCVIPPVTFLLHNFWTYH